MNLKLKDNPNFRLGITRLEYIECTGTQYIDTGIIPTNNTTIIADCSRFLCVYTYQGNGGGLWFGFFGNEIYGSTYNAGTYIFSNFINRHLLELNHTYLKIDDITVKTWSNSSVPSTTIKMRLFGGYEFSTSTWRYSTSSKLYRYTITNNNIIELDLIPCITDLGTPGMYDTVSKTFFYNQGTGDFIAGPVVVDIPENISFKTTTFYHNNCPNTDGYLFLKSILNNQLNYQDESKYNYYKDSQLWNSIKTAYPDLVPYTDACHAMLGDICTCITPGPMQLASECNDFINGGSELEYIESTGTQYIDTGIKLTNSNYTFKIGVSFVSNDWGAQGAVETNRAAAYAVVFRNTNNNSLSINWGSWSEAGSVLQSNYPTETLAELEIKAGNLVILNGINTSITAQVVSYSTGRTANFILFGSYNAYDGGIAKSKVRVHYFIVENNSVEIIHLVPCITDLNTPGMYDTVSKQFFYNQGTDDFIAGPITYLAPGINITDYIPDCTYDETPIILLNRVRVDIGNVSGSISELMQYSTLNGFNDAYELQTKPRLIGTWTINDWYSTSQLAQAQAAFDGLTIVGDANISYDIIDEHTIHILSTTVPSIAPMFITSDITKIYIGAGSSSSDDNTLMSAFSSDSKWSSYSSLLDTWYNYLHPTT